MNKHKEKNRMKKSYMINNWNNNNLINHYEEQKIKQENKRRMK